MLIPILGRANLEGCSRPVRAAGRVEYQDREFEGHRPCERNSPCPRRRIQGLESRVYFREHLRHQSIFRGEVHLLVRARNKANRENVSTFQGGDGRVYEQPDLRVDLVRTGQIASATQIPLI